MLDEIGNGVSIGTNATILPVSICDGVVISAGAVRTEDILGTRNLPRKSGAPTSALIIL
jgi:serine acetyltransferase